MSYWVIERRLRNGAMVALGTPGVGEDLIGAVTEADERDVKHPATIWRFADEATAGHILEILSDKTPEGKEFTRYSEGEGWTREDECFWGAVEVSDE